MDTENQTKQTTPQEHVAFKCVTAATQIANTVLFLVFVGISGRYFSSYTNF